MIVGASSPRAVGQPKLDDTNLVRDLVEVVAQLQQCGVVLLGHLLHFLSGAALAAANAEPKGAPQRAEFGHWLSPRFRSGTSRTGRATPAVAGLCRYERPPNTVAGSAAYRTPDRKQLKFNLPVASVIDRLAAMSFIV